MGWDGILDDGGEDNAWKSGTGRSGRGKVMAIWGGMGVMLVG